MLTKVESSQKITLSSKESVNTKQITMIVGNLNDSRLITYHTCKVFYTHIYI